MTSLKSKQKNGDNCLFFFVFFFGGGADLAQSSVMVLKTWVDSAWRACGAMKFQSLMMEGKECLWASDCSGLLSACVHRTYCNHFAC